MHRHNIPVTILFILFFTLAINAQVRLTLTWEVLKYDLVATLPQDYSADRDLDVTATLNLKNIGSRSSSTLSMRISDQAKVSAVSINGSTADFSSKEEKIVGEQKLQKVVVGVPAIPKGGTVTALVKYKLTVKANSGLNALSPVGSQFLPLSHWYPTPTSWYFAGGADFAPFNLKVNSSGGETVISSGNKTANGFEQKLNGQPFFTTGQWDNYNSNGVEVLVPKGMNANSNISKELAGLAAEVKTFAVGLLGKSFESPIRIVGVNRGAGFSDSGTIFVDESVFNRQKLDLQTTTTVSEGVIKTWLGNVVKVEGDGYGVIREGLSRYIMTEFLEKKFGKEVADLERLRQRTNYSAISLRDAPLNILSPIDGYYYTSSANKGAMIWNYLSNTFGEDFFKLIQLQAEDGVLELSEIRSVFSSEKEYLDYVLEKVTEMNLMIGLPQQTGSQVKAALRNLSDIDVSVDVVATSSNGEKLVNKVIIKAKSFGEAVFNTSDKIVRVEVDADKIYPQTDYSDDIAPREMAENDALVFIKREFDRQKFSEAEKNAVAVLRVYPIFDDARILLARSQLAQGKTADAQKNFQAVLDQKLPSAQSLAWANVGLGEIAQRTGQNLQAKQYFDQAIKTDSELSATITARRGRNKLGTSENTDSETKAFFESFDKAVSANSKAEIESMIIKGEIARFASSIAGQAQAWSTQILHLDMIDANNLLVETKMNVKLLNRENESGMAVYRLSKVGNSWKLSDVEIFEVG